MTHLGLRDFVRRLDRRLFRRSVHLIDLVNGARMDIDWHSKRLESRIDELEVQLRQAAEEQRAAYVAIRAIIDAQDRGRSGGSTP